MSSKVRRAGAVVRYSSDRNREHDQPYTHASTVPNTSDVVNPDVQHP